MVIYHWQRRAYLARPRRIFYIFIFLPTESSMIHFIDSINGITPDMLAGFFQSWKEALNVEGSLQILENSSNVNIALDESTGKFVGFINAITNDVLSAHVPMPEMLSLYRRQGIGKELVRKMLQALDEYHIVDLLCNREL